MNTPSISVRDKILYELYKNKGSYISGEKLASALDVSRNAISKSVAKLKKQGYSIDAVTNKGYSLASSDDKLSEAGIKVYLNEKYPAFEPGTFVVYDLTDSTNSEAKRLILKGAAHGTVVISDSQTNGRGRMSRNFYSPPGTGLYMTLIVNPNFDISKAVLVTAMAAVASARAISTVCGIETNIKWVNDLYLENKKVAGILTEAVSNFETGQIESVIIGVGINITEPEGGFPRDIKEKAGSLSQQCHRNAIAGELTHNIMTMLETIEERNFISEYKERNMVLNRNIQIARTGEKAKAVDISCDAGLVIEYADGTLDTLSTGEISIILE
ncbi:MAG: biotin--[acetyl-CoA-carboxylase] ligase [Eubacteriales bacterium]|nr:biotin--[acetyl-CoA-carboxylase] ligase [Eubacteriales bacterium]MDD4390474.1 biotin--[acetyl-CoA-carboxylase] ligase [Eubacteriales bacterium]